MLASIGRSGRPMHWQVSLPPRPGCSAAEPSGGGMPTQPGSSASCKPLPAISPAAGRRQRSRGCSTSSGVRRRGVLPPLSIIIPSHNRPDLLSVCLARVQRYAPTETEILVVDDASPAACVSETTRQFPGVRLLRLQQRGGFAVAANLGVQAAQHPIIELLNDDTEVTAAWAEAALSRFTDATVAAVAPLVLRRGEDPKQEPRIDSAGDRYFLGGIAGKRGHGEPLRPDYLRPCSVFGASASSAFYRRETFLSVGGFPEQFGAYFEDVDLSFRLHAAG